MAVSKKLKKIVQVFVGLTLILVGAFVMRLVGEGKNSQQMMNPQIFSRPGVFVECPESPNCVSSQEDPSNDLHYIDPLELRDNPIEAIREELVSIDGVEIVRGGEFVLRATQTSSLFGFVDDFAFFYDTEARILHSYSASRVGYSDLGANRKRIKSLLARIQ